MTATDGPEKPGGEVQPSGLSFGEAPPPAPMEGGGLSFGLAEGEVEALGGEGDMSSIFGAPAAPPAAAPAAQASEAVGGTFLGDTSLTEDIGDLGFSTAAPSAASAAAPIAAEGAKEAAAPRRINGRAVAAIAGAALLAGLFLAGHLFRFPIRARIKGGLAGSIEQRILLAELQGVEKEDVRVFTANLRQAVNSQRVEIADFQELDQELKKGLRDGALGADEFQLLRERLAQMR